MRGERERKVEREGGMEGVREMERDRAQRKEIERGESEGGGEREGEKEMKRECENERLRERRV